MESKNYIAYSLQILAIIVCVYFIYKNLRLESKDKKSVQYLNLFFVVIGFVQFFSIVSSFVPTKFAIFLIPVLLLVATSFPPIIYLYVNSIILKSKKVAVRSHFVAPASLALLNFLFIIGYTAAVSETFLKKIMYWGIFGTSIGGLIGMFLISCVYYLYYSFRLVSHHQKAIGTYYSYEENIDLKWVKVFLVGFVLFVIGTSLTSYFDNNYLINKIGYDVLVLIYIAFVGTNALKQQKTIDVLVAEINEKDNQELIEVPDIDVNIPSEPVLDDKLLEIKLKLEQVMLSEKPYLSTNLSIYELADKVDTNYKYLSKIINTAYNQNFVSYINQFRIEESQKRLLAPEYQIYTIEAIANDCGFKSKSAFHTAFKKITGMTPLEYKNKNDVII